MTPAFINVYTKAPAVLITIPTTFTVVGAAVFMTKKPITVVTVPFTAPTIVVVRAEFVIVQKNREKFSRLPSTDERLRTATNSGDKSTSASTTILPNSNIAAPATRTGREMRAWRNRSPAT